jgi:hypothetical protein
LWDAVGYFIGYSTGYIIQYNQTNVLDISNDTKPGANIGPYWDPVWSNDLLKSAKWEYSKHFPHLPNMINRISYILWFDLLNHGDIPNHLWDIAGIKRDQTFSRDSCSYGHPIFKQSQMGLNQTSWSFHFMEKEKYYIYINYIQ